MCTKQIVLEHVPSLIVPKIVSWRQAIPDCHRKRESLFVVAKLTYHSTLESRILQKFFAPISVFKPDIAPGTTAKVKMISIRVC